MPELTAAMNQLTKALGEHAAATDELAQRLPSRRTSRWLAFITIIAAVAAVAALVTAISIRTTQVSTKHTLLTDTQILKLVESVVGPGPTSESNARTRQLVSCLDNRIDFDAGKVKTISAGCPPAP